MENMFKIKCPSFDDFMLENMKETTLSPVNGTNIATCTILPDMSKKQIREYGHPVDVGLIRILDNPMVNSVFKSFVDMAVDAQYGPVIASGIPVNENTFPELDMIVNRCVDILGIKRPYVIVSDSVGFNAVTLGSDEEPYIILGNLLLTALNEDQIRFVIGHECGHIAMGHVVYHTTVTVAGNLSNTIPVVGPIIFNTAGFAIKAWNRRSEITADRAGFLCCGDLEISKKTLMQLEMRFLHNENLNVDDYIEASRRYRKGGMLRKIGEYSAEHPILPKRIEALDAFANSQLFYCITNQIIPANAFSNVELTKKIENMIRIL